MAFVIADRVQETTTTAGTGTITLAGASTGFQSFAAIGNGNNTYYTIAARGTSEWEVGIGTYTASGTTLSRDTVLSSSNSGNLVDFSAGTKDVFVTPPSSRSLLVQSAGSGLFAGTTAFTANGAVYASSTSVLTSGTLPVASGGTGLTSGTSGGIPYYSASATIASSAALAANALVIGGGAGVAPSTTTTGTGVLTAIGNTANAASGLAVLNASGLLAIAQGGTNSSATATAGAVSYGTGTAYAFTAAGSSGQVLTSAGASAPTWTTATNANTASAIVQRDASGNFSAGTITATLSGNATNVTGTVAVANGGTGLTATPTNGQLDIGNGSGFTRAALTQGTGITVTNGAGSITIANAGVTGLTGTANQVTVSASTGSVTLSTPQSIGTASSVQFGSLGVGTAASGTTGEIRATNNVTAYYSDDRLKTRLGTIDKALEKVGKLTGFYYEANETAQALGYKVKREVGVSAQEVQAVLPEIIAPAPIDEQYMTIYYERLVPLLIEAVKELTARVAALEAKGN